MSSAKFSCEIASALKSPKRWQRKVVDCNMASYVQYLVILDVNVMCLIRMQKVLSCYVRSGSNLSFDGKALQLKSDNRRFWSAEDVKSSCSS